MQRDKALEQLEFLGGYLLSLDGTGYLSSKQVHCDSCLEKRSKKTGEITYSHQMLGAAIVHPERREVIPLMPEPIIKQDGETKNDCEHNPVPNELGRYAAKRFLTKLRQDHPQLPFIAQYRTNWVGMPPAHRKYSEWSPERFLRWAAA